MGGNPTRRKVCCHSVLCMVCEERFSEHIRMSEGGIQVVKFNISLADDPKPQPLKWSLRSQS